MQIVNDLKRTRDTTLSYFELGEEDLQRSYSPGKWTIRQLLLHLADADSVLYDRIRRTISSPGQTISAFDQDLWAQHLDYHTFPLSVGRAVYAAVRDAVIYLAEQHYEGSEEKTFMHSETGLRTLKDEFDKVVRHNQRHLDQIARALAPLTSP